MSYINMTDNCGNTPLHSAMFISGFEGLPSTPKSTAVSIQKLLIKYGADVNSINKCEQTPFVWAYTTRHGVTAGAFDLMMENGLKITEDMASQVFKRIFEDGSQHEILKSSHIIKELVRKGGRIPFDANLENVWEWGEPIQKVIESIQSAPLGHL